LSPFRFFLKLTRARAKKSIRKICEIDESYLQELWINQKGICPYTGWTLQLPYGSEGWKGEVSTNRASLDRKDSSKGYVKGNLQFISFMANLAKNNFTESELIKFCQAVVKNREI
jgi:hypothetical protein